MHLGKGQNIPEIFPFYSIYVDRWALHSSFQYKGFKAMGKAVDFPEKCEISLNIYLKNM